MTASDATIRDPWTDRLSEYLDGELTGREREALEAHLEGCAACRGVLEELRGVVARAASLVDREPPADLWSGIAARIGAAPADELAAARARRARRWQFTLPQLAAAAFLLVLLSGGTVWVALSRLHGPSIDSRAPAAVAIRPEVQAVPADFGTVRYEAAIAELEQVLREHRAELDPATVEVIEKNLRLIDQATDQARRALASDPANPYLNGHLAEQMRRKVDLLRQATAVVSDHS